MEILYSLLNILFYSQFTTKLTLKFIFRIIFRKNKQQTINYKMEAFRYSIIYSFLIFYEYAILKPYLYFNNIEYEEMLKIIAEKKIKGLK